MNEYRVGIFSGRFQPPTKAHAHIIEIMSKENYKNIIFLVKGKKTSKDKERNPFDEEIQIKLLKSICPHNVEVKVISTGFFIKELNEMEESSFILYTGSDRFDSYNKYPEYMEEGKVLEVKKISREDADISASKVRKALINNNKSSFESLTDDRNYNMFEKLKTYM